MKIVVKGVLPKPKVVTYTGICTNCRCQVEAEAGDPSIMEVFDNYKGHCLPTCLCPTQGCGCNIALREKVVRDGKGSGKV